MVRALATLRRLFAFDRNQAALFEYLKRSRKSVQAGDDRLMVVQCVEDLYYYGMFGRIVNSMRELEPLRVEQFVLRSLNVGEDKSVFTFLFSRIVKNRVHNAKWVRLYRAVCDGVAYRSDSSRPLADLIDLIRAWKSWRKLTNKQALIDLVIDGVPVGDLINDTYIRFKPAPTVNLRDRYMLATIWQAYRDVRRATTYFRSRRPRLFLTSYSAYVQHGVAVRAALQSGVRVFSFGEYQEFAKELSPRDWFHTVDPDHLRVNFEKLDRRQERLAVAEAALSKRLGGGIDSATVYMKHSAYANSGEPVPDVKDAVIVFLHDFYDSPYIYRDMVFSDFWDWTCFTIEVLTKAGIRFYLKPHPNQIQLNDDVLAELRKRYPEIQILSTKISNLQLVNGGMAAAVTVYGSVANEMAYLGVPTICCSRHAHSSFDFCSTAKTAEQYAELLCSWRGQRVDPKAMREQSLIFYYMFNYGKGDADRALTDEAMRFRLAVVDESKGAAFPELLGRIAALPAFNHYVSSWSQIVRIAPRSTSAADASAVVTETR